MPLFVMIAKDKPDSAALRTTHRPAHLDHLTALGDRLVFGGALMDTDGTPGGSLLVLEAETLEAATASFMVDPFIVAGIFGSVEVKPWRIAFNHSGREF